jgi:hypothetical protein
MTLMRRSEEGYREVMCPDERRGLWFRVTGEHTIELCAGREGDDSYFKAKVGEPFTLDQLKALEDVLLYAIYAVEVAEDDWISAQAVKRMEEEAKEGAS